MTHPHANLLGEVMDAIAEVYDRKDVSESEGLTVLLTVAGALIAMQAASPHHLQQGISLAHAHIRRIAEAYHDDEEPKQWKH